MTILDPQTQSIQAFEQDRELQLPLYLRPAYKGEDDGRVPLVREARRIDHMSVVLGYSSHEHTPNAAPSTAGTILAASGLWIEYFKPDESLRGMARWKNDAFDSRASRPISFARLHSETPLSIASAATVILANNHELGLPNLHQILDTTTGTYFEQSHAH